MLYQLGFLSSRGRDRSFPPLVDCYTVPYTAPNAPVLDYLRSFNEGTFGTRITRLSDGNGLIHHYSKNQPWNCDMTRIELSNRLLDARTYEILDTIDDGLADSDRRWSHVAPNRLYSCYPANFRFYDTDTKQITVIKDYAAEFESCRIGFHEGNLSNDDHYVVLNCGSKAATTHIVILDVWQGLEVARMPVQVATDWAGMSPSGKWVVVRDGDPLTHKVYDVNLNLIGDLGPGSHADIAMDASGNEYLVTVDVSNDNLCKALLPDGDRQILLDLPANISGHVSCRNIQRPGFCYYSFSKYHPTRSFDLMGAVDVSRTNTRLTEAFGYSRSTASSYNSEPHGVVSPDGKKMIFASDWMNPSGPIYSYIVEMA